MMQLYKSSTSDLLRSPSIPQISHAVSSIYDDEADPASAIAAALASAKLLFSPCFPFCVNCPVSQYSFFDYQQYQDNATYRPLCESQLHLSSSLSLQPLILLQTPAHDACCDREVFVITIEAFVSSESQEMN
jgi:hypothetical protein